MKRYDFPKNCRLLKRRQFREVYDQGQSVRSGYFVVFYLKGGSPERVARMGITVTKRYGGAVMRNRIKRLIREVYRQIRHEIPHGVDLVINVRNAAVDLSCEEVRRELRSCLVRAEILMHEID